MERPLISHKENCFQGRAAAGSFRSLIYCIWSDWSGIEHFFEICTARSDSGNVHISAYQTL